MEIEEFRNQLIQSLNSLDYIDEIEISEIIEN